MSGETEVVTILRRLDTKIDRLMEDMRGVKHRLTSLVIQVTNIAASEEGHYAGLATRLDALSDRVDRIERRPDIVPA